MRNSNERNFAIFYQLWKTSKEVQEPKAFEPSLFAVDWAAERKRLVNSSKLTVIVPGVSALASLGTVHFVESFAAHLTASTVAPPFGKHLNSFIYE